MSGRLNGAVRRLAPLVALALFGLASAAAAHAQPPLPVPLGTPPAPFSPAPAPSPLPGSGGALYAEYCSYCHGPTGMGNIGPSQEADAFPSLVYGMVDRGGIAMPSFSKGFPRAPLTSQQIAAIADFVATYNADPVARTANASDGGVIFRLYCSGCHGETGRGGALVGGKNAPNLSHYPAAEAIAAMIIGRSNMPVFAGTTLDVRQQTAVALYVETLEQPASPGGRGLGYVGPVAEGLVSFAGLAILLVIAGWLAWGKGGLGDERRPSTARRPEHVIVPDQRREDGA
jgi:quinol---cytochrome-c reductase cytochrome c subunit